MLYMAVFAHSTLRRSIGNFLHITFSGLNFVLYRALFGDGTLRRLFMLNMAVFVHPTPFCAKYVHYNLRHTVCAVHSSFCTWYYQADILCYLQQFLYIGSLSS